MILVTGGTGLIGSHLLFELTSQNKRVRALKRFTSDIGLVEFIFKHYTEKYSEQLERIDWVEGDIEDFDFLSQMLIGVTEVYHCAALVSFNANDDSRMLEINVGGTANMVNASLQLNIEKFCHVSSIAALGEPLANAKVDENALWGKSKYKSGYAISKFRSEMEVWQGIEMGLKAVIVNPSVVIGPGRWDSGSGQMFGAISKGFPFYTLGVTGYVDARDVAKSMITAMDSGIFGKRFILNSENLTYKQVFGMMASALGKKSLRIEVKPWMGSIALPFIQLASIVTRKAPTVTRSTLRSSHKTTYYNSFRAHAELGIQFTPVSDAIANAAKAGRFK